MKIVYAPNVNTIITFYLLEKEYNLNKYTINSVLESELSKDKNILKGIIFTIENSVKLDIPSYYVNDGVKTIQTISLYDALEYAKKNPDNKEFIFLLRNTFPYPLTKDIDKNNLGKMYPQFKDPQYEVTKNISNSIFFFDYMEEISKFIIYNKNNLDLDKIIPLTIRLYIPKELLRICIEKELLSIKNIILETPLLCAGHLLYENIIDISDEDAELMKDKLIADSKLYNKYKSESILSSNCLYDVIITLPIYSWRNLIQKIKEYEHDYSHSVIGNIPYMLQSVKPVYELLTKENNNV